MSYYSTHKEERLQYRKDYYNKNKDTILSRYRENKEKRIEQQKQYNKEHKEDYNKYQLDYYHKIKNSEKYRKMKKIWYQRYYAKKHKQTIEDRLSKQIEKQIEKNKKLLNSVFKELLKKTDYIHPIDIQVKEQPKQIETLVDGFRINKQGFFVLDF